jgi:hypothetical protein
MRQLCGIARSRNVPELRCRRAWPGTGRRVAHRPSSVAARYDLDRGLLQFLPLRCGPLIVPPWLAHWVASSFAHVPTRGIARVVAIHQARCLSLVC